MQNLLFSDSQQPLILRDLKWINRSPYLITETLTESGPSGVLQEHELSPGAFIGITSTPEDLEAAGLTPTRFCNGYSQAKEEGIGFTHTPCPEGSSLTKGKQCDRCLARDDFSAMHSIHRGATVTGAAAAYADLEHWLYIATFPDGTSKVGTSSLHSKPRRLDEQAVACATYIAHATDGRQVRIWEDLVSQEAGLVQIKQVKAKFKAWSNPLPATHIKEAHDKAVQLATWALQEAALFEDFIDEEQIIAEPWEPSLPMHRAYEALTTEPKPLTGFPSLTQHSAGFYTLGATGKFLIAHLGDPDHTFIINLAEIFNRAVLPTEKLSAEPQTSLF